MGCDAIIGISRSPRCLAVRRTRSLTSASHRESHATPNRQNDPDRSRRSLGYLQRHARLNAFTQFTAVPARVSGHPQPSAGCSPPRAARRPLRKCHGEPECGPTAGRRVSSARPLLIISIVASTCEYATPSVRATSFLSRSAPRRATSASPGNSEQRELPTGVGLEHGPEIIIERSDLHGMQQSSSLLRPISARRITSI